MKNNELKKALSDGTAILIGFIPIGMAFGILSKDVGITLVECMMFSAIVFAGASQFIALSLVGLGAGIGEIVLTTLLINFRHFLMSASLATKIDESMKKYRPLIAFAVIDEVFSLASFKKDGLSKEYLFTLQIISYLSWNAGTALGYILGGILPYLLKTSVGIGLYAMFAAILVPEIKGSKVALILAIGSGILNTLFINVLKMPQGWSIVLVILVVAGLGVKFFKEEEVASDE